MTATLEHISATEKDEILLGIDLDSGVFRTLRRGIGDEEGAIIESGYKISDGSQTGSGICYEKEHPPYHASRRYSELNKLLGDLEK